jgi:hypothetical protein
MRAKLRQHYRIKYENANHRQYEEYAACQRRPKTPGMSNDESHCNTRKKNE